MPAMAQWSRRKLGERFEEALVYSARIHDGQVRKASDIPYVSHLLGVAALVLEDGGDEDEAIGALLHDAAEDQGGRERLEDIRRRFGDRVAAIVDGCTDTYETPKPDWDLRKRAYIEHLREVGDPGILRVSLADKLHNARSILRDLSLSGDEVWERFTRGREQQLWYYGALVEVFRGRVDSPMVAELDVVLAEMRNRGPIARVE